MKIKILGNVVAVVSSITRKQIETLSKLNPKALAVVDPDTKNEIFKVSMGKSGLVNQYGITFNRADEGGLVSVTIEANDKPVAEIKKEFVENNAQALAHLKTIEAQVETAFAAAEALYAEIAESVETL